MDDGREVRLRLVGEFAVLLGPRRLTGVGVGSRKARTLLALLAAAGGRLVYLDAITEALWGENWPARPADNVATLVSRLRATLEPDIVLGGRSGYRLGGHVRVDLWEAGELIAVAEGALAGDPRRAMRLAGDVARMLSESEVFPDAPDAAWAEPARAAQADVLRRALHVTAAAALRRRHLREARQAAQAAVDRDPYDEIACRLLMRAYELSGEPARALAAYERLRATLADELGIDPAPATGALHVAILRGATLAADR
ncbi:MAG TPA: BTAD domain-containing putative transcriptional regulator [Nonomuraea sp.]|nr:BTAD domain-containing putative transcriptional regulator [Nonomuraea sp.]